MRHSLAYYLSRAAAEVSIPALRLAWNPAPVAIVLLSLVGLGAQTKPGWAQVQEERLKSLSEAHMRQDAITSAQREMLVDVQVRLRLVEQSLSQSKGQINQNREDLLELRWWVLASGLGGGLIGGGGSGFVIRRKLANGPLSVTKLERET